MIQKLLFIFLLCTCLSGYSQITGLVTNSDNEPLPYVNIYLKNSTTGTTTNGDGNYSLSLSKAGTYTVVFQFLGYTTKELEVRIDQYPYELNTVLTEETTSLDEIIVDTKGNPADRIIREVINKKPEILKKQNAYTADFYSRGLWRVENAPEKFLGQKIGDLGGGLDSTRTGIVYLSETISKIAYQAPDDFKETITASKVSGNDNGFSFNSAQEADYSFYNNTLEINSQLVSPIADNAFRYYSYKLVGAFREDKKLINKIEVTPKRKNDRIFEGIIYVVEEDWQLYGADLKTTGTAIQVPFVEELVFKHNFKYDAEKELWIKISQSIDFSFKLLGFGGNGRFTAVYSNYNFEPQFDRTSFTNEVLSFQPEANKKDSLFWQKIRPVPLTLEERSDYVVKDSLQEIRDSKPYKDSIDGVNNKFSLADPLLGYTYNNTYERWRVGYKGPLPELRFNTVQGFNAKAGLFYNTWTEDYKQATYANLDANYGIDDDRLRFTGSLTKRFNRSSNRTMGLLGGTKVQQFNAREPISTLINSVATLFWERNYMKVYELDYARLFYSEELFNGFKFYANASYEKRSPLFNTTDQVWIKNRIDYTSNNPLAPNDSSTPAIQTHQLGKLNARAVINFDQKYMSYPDGKFNIGESKYPTLTLNIEQTFAASISDFNFTQFAAQLKQEFDISNKGSFGYNLRGGTFFNSDNISFVDYQHFSGNQTRINLEGKHLNGFNLLPYYDFSTNSSYFEGHLEHNFKGFILGKIPGIRALNANFILGSHSLITHENKPYYEFSAGIGNLGFGKLKFLRIDYVRSINGPNTDGVFVFGLSF
ncbi:DUF5686 and carboxypeptidase regulatory-like domain-containing protein [Leeuwenhoekiella marinoflava]|uniref:Carboxypeptidase-like protein n=2 Tax=Leeuwenhoekiella marinoflava TaxID=988 RepID=A0A4Q0PP44_9FLAO|nr:DUF5686 and carboxypeptidase regulatory-like domain-containing protein [Leeuwenhoekiella marinoflava]RXG32253.1 carboxypeptidase-like protein [Leeuwenhoekiella marinoflava]SHE81771.1 CarboxypepD_reg-like domain-containing protein [Leeuwenhoekiella marinoflava DSM 3653]